MTRRDEHLATQALKSAHLLKEPAVTMADRLQLPEPARLALHYLAAEIINKLGVAAAVRIADRYEAQGRSIAERGASPAGEQLITQVLLEELDVLFSRRLHQDDEGERLSA